MRTASGQILHSDEGNHGLNLIWAGGQAQRITSELLKAR
jgi:hypothetical protein